MPKVRPNGGIIRVKKDRNPIKPILSNRALNSEQVCNQRRYTVHDPSNNYKLNRVKILESYNRREMLMKDTF